MSERNKGLPQRFVPAGVDAQSWIGFEHRIQERRFKGLVQSIDRAIAERDAVSARAAIEEAAELRPGAPELQILSARVALLPVAMPPRVVSSHLWSRGLGAAAMFVVGVGLVMGIESLRPAETEQRATPAPAPAVPAPDLQARAAAPETPLPIAPAAQGDTNGAPVVPNVVVESATVAAASAAPVAAVPNRVAAVPNREEPVGTAGVPRPPTVDARLADVQNRPAARPALEPAGDTRGGSPEPVVQASREGSDSDAAAAARSENRPAFTDVITPSPAIAANVMPQPVSITAPPPPAATASAAGSTIAPRSDNSRVAQVLNQYARAYGRLDPGAARAVWPTVDERALTRAFASLESQDVSFDRCDIDVKGNLASASCRGTASYVGKVGSRQARTEPRQWNFELKLHGDDWKIEKAQASAR